MFLEAKSYHGPTERSDACLGNLGWAVNAALEDS